MTLVSALQTAAACAAVTVAYLLLVALAPGIAGEAAMAYLILIATFLALKKRP